MKERKTATTISYPVFSAEVSSFEALRSLDFPSAHFVLLLAADFDSMPKEEVISVAESLIESGLAYVCTWGPGCAKAHDCFDLGKIQCEEKHNSEFHVMSTDHENEPLDEALWFALYCAIVDDKISEQCSVVVVSVCNDEWSSVIESNLSDIGAFNDRMTDV